MGTDGQGIRMFYDKPDLFGSILLKDLPINIQNPIRSLYTDDDQSLWLGTKGDGIVRIQAYDTYHNKKMIPQSAITHIQQPGVLLPKKRVPSMYLDWHGRPGTDLLFV